MLHIQLYIIIELDLLLALFCFACIISNNTKKVNHKISWVCFCIWFFSDHGQVSIERPSSKAFLVFSFRYPNCSENICLYISMDIWVIWILSHKHVVMAMIGNQNMTLHFNICFAKKFPLNRSIKSWCILKCIWCYNKNMRRKKYGTITFHVHKTKYLYIHWKQISLWAYFHSLLCFNTTR